MSTITASHWVVVRKLVTPSGRIHYLYLNRLMATRIANSSTIRNARAFKTEEEARRVLQILNGRFWENYILQEVTKDLDTLNKDGLPYSSRYKVLRDVA